MFLLVAGRVKKLSVLGDVRFLQVFEPVGLVLDGLAVDRAGGAVFRTKLTDTEEREARIIL